MVIKKYYILAAAIACVSTLQIFAAERRPNVVLILADDLGYETIGANGCTDYKTPALDQMAATGVRFENCFANPLCTPSRVKIMTGMYNVRNYVKFGFMDRGQKTFAHEFKKAGYATCIAGKWQLGNESDSPRHFGFDESCLWQHMRGRTKSHAKDAYDSRYPNPWLEINGQPKDYNNGEYGPDVCSDFVCDFMEKNRDKPFLVYYPMILTHCPFVPTPDSKDWDSKDPGSTSYKGDGKYFGDMVHYMDKMVGEVMAKLDELGLCENTLVIFTGDNGTDHIASMLNGEKIMGGKGQMNDNGTRVPLIVNFPGSIKSGLVSDELVDFSDFLPTLCDAAGIPVPNDRPVDGRSFWSTCKGETGRNKPWVYVWYRGQVFARTRTHMLLCKSDLTGYKYINYSDPYKKVGLQESLLDEKAKEEFALLKKVIEDLAVTRLSAVSESEHKVDGAGEENGRKRKKGDGK